MGPISKITLFSDFADLHKGLFINLLLLEINIYVLTITYNLFILVPSSFLLAYSISMLDIFTNTSIIAQTQHKIGRSIIISHGFMMIGAFLSSLCLSIWAGASLQLFGVICFLFSFAFLRLEHLEPEKEGQESGKGLPPKVLLKMCGIMFIYASIEHSFHTWYSPFAVLMGYLSKEMGAFIVSIMTFIMIYTLVVELNTLRYT